MTTDRPWGEDPRAVALREAALLIRKRAGQVRQASGRTIPAGEAARRANDLMRLARKVESL